MEKKVQCPVCGAVVYLSYSEERPGVALPESGCTHYRSDDPFAYAKNAIQDARNRGEIAVDIPEGWIAEQRDWLLERLPEHFGMAGDLVFGDAENEATFAKEIGRGYLGSVAPPPPLSL